MVKIATYNLFEEFFLVIILALVVHARTSLTILMR